MSTSERIPFQVEMSKIIELLTKQIYQSPLALLRENCQNAYDAILQRLYYDQRFKPEIKIYITQTEISVTDNGIGMSKDDLSKHYWKAGSSGKNNPEARAAGVVGTFGIGAMANFGIARELIVATEPVKGDQRIVCKAVRETLSTTEDCIEIISETPIGEPGTTVIAKIQPETSVDVNQASAYIGEIVRFLNIPVIVNDILVSQQEFEIAVPKLSSEWQANESNAILGSQVKADVELIIARTGEVWIKLSNIHYSENAIEGIVLLRQGLHQIYTFRSRFALATAAVSSFYGFGGIADLKVLEPTAGREALTTSSLQLLQILVTEVESYVSQKIALTLFSDMNTGFMEWVAQHRQFELCSNLSIRIEPENKSLTLGQIREMSQTHPLNYFEGSDPTLINQYATEEKPLIIISTRQPRRKCELSYIKAFCKVIQVQDAPTVVTRKNERDWTTSEQAFVFRAVNILDSDYFVKVRFGFGKITHGLPVYVDTTRTPIDIVIDSDAPTMSMMLTLYREDIMAFSGMVKDYVRSAIFPRIANFVPSSTRQGAEAFLRTIRRPREVLEYDRDDLLSFTTIWQDYLEGKISLYDAAQKSTVLVQKNIQIFDRSATVSVATVIPDVLENQKILENVVAPNTQEIEALPAITRLDKECAAKLLTIKENESALNGYRCFIALTDGVREERMDFFLQPHRTEIVWGGQKALYIFQHHSGEFGLYYELQGTELLSDSPGGKSFPTCTIILKNQIYIPIPDEIRHKFIPINEAKKRFEVRCELLYPDLEQRSPNN